MEKRVLKIKLKALGTKISTNSTPERGRTSLLLEGAGTIHLSTSSEEDTFRNTRKDMKRKRQPRADHKKGKRNDPVKDPAVASICVNTEDDTCLDQSDDDQPNSEMDIVPSSLGSDKLTNVSNVNADVPNEKSRGKTGHGRVKVKLKTARVLEPHRSYSDAQTPSDTDKSNAQVTLEMNDTVVEKEDSAYSDGQTSEMQNTVSEKLPKKQGSIKIKSSRALGLSGENKQEKNSSKVNGPPQVLGGNVVLENEKTTDSVPRNLRHRETKLLYRDPRYNEKELSAALAVIKKVMKMDAAGPFNTPVNPDALGIPDYFDIIDTPMDFGTISDNLERGHKYMNSEDVYKDVQIIWDNCYKYNNKGDYILDLMKRVKKNFTKYWLAAGLYSDNGATESAQSEDAKSGQEKLHPKSKSKHKRRRYRIDRHKSDCLCAVCVVRRRRKEREESLTVIESRTVIIDADLHHEFKQEGSSPADNPDSEDATSSLDHSLETDVNVEMEEAENELKMETPDRIDSEQPESRIMMDNEKELNHTVIGSHVPFQPSPLENGTEDSNLGSQDQDMDLGFATQSGDQKGDAIVQQEEEATVHDQQAERRQEGDWLQEESAERTRVIKVQEMPVLQENHSVLQLCRSLFPSNLGSVWNGPHSLTRRHVVVRDSPIHTAVATLLKQ